MGSSLVNPLDILSCLYSRRKNYEQKTISFKVDDFTVTLHRGEEEPEGIAQEQMARYLTCLYNMAMKPMVNYYEEYYPELKTDTENIMQKHIYKKTLIIKN